MISEPRFMHARVCHLTISGLQLLVLALISMSVWGQTPQPKNSNSGELLEQFKSEKVWWRQNEVAKKIIALHDKSVLPALASWLNHEDRHVRGNAALIFAAFGDDRGFDVISAMLTDRSDRPEGQGQVVVSSDRRYHVEQQIKADRYNAAHLLGELKDRRAVPLLIEVLHDQEIGYIVPWALAEIGDNRADAALINMLADKDASMRVLAILALEKLNAREAIPDLRALLTDHERAKFAKQESVSEAARAAIARLDAKP
jgi:HEAT repeat protein